MHPTRAIASRIVVLRLGLCGVPPGRHRTPSYEQGMQNDTAEFLVCKTVKKWKRYENSAAALLDASAHLVLPTIKGGPDPFFRITKAALAKIGIFATSPTSLGSSIPERTFSAHA